MKLSFSQNLGSVSAIFWKAIHIRQWRALTAWALCAALVFISVSMVFFHQHAYLAVSVNSPEAFAQSDADTPMEVAVFFNCVACIYSSTHIADGFAGQARDIPQQYSVFIHFENEIDYSSAFYSLSSRAPPA